MKKMNLVAIMLIIAALFTAGCLGGDDGEDKPSLAVGSVTETANGFCGNPQWDGAEDNKAVHTFTVPAEKIVLAYKLTLTWSDDMHGSTENDIYDNFELKAKTGDTTEKEKSDTGEIIIIIGGENFGSNETSGNSTMDQASLIPEYTTLNNTCEITVTLTEGGWENVTPRGLLITYDQGNSWTLNLEAIVLGDPNAAPSEPAEEPAEE